MLDRAAFLRPIAHRGLHEPRGPIENTAAAFEAAIARGFGIECDLQPAADGTPMVFHDATLDRLMAAAGPVSGLAPGELKALCYRGTGDRMMSLPEIIELVGGRVPLLAEIKSDWRPPRPGFLEAIAGLAAAYRGPIALMSFDPAVLAAIARLAPAVPRGIISHETPPRGPIDQARAFALTHLLECRLPFPDLVAYCVADLPTPVTRFVREVMGVPLFAWTVRSPEDWSRARQWADAPIFEGGVPAG